MLFDGKWKVATEEHCHLPWCGEPDGRLFRCYLCDHKFVVGDKWRFVLNDSGKGVGSFLVCVGCDGPDVFDRWEARCERAQQKFPFNS